jgi:integrase
MSVRWNEQRKRWTVDVDWEHVSGARERVRKFSPVNTRRGAEEYERQIRAELLTRKATKEEAPTLAGFWPEFLEKYCVVHNRPHEIKMKRTTWRRHLEPAFGALPMDRITPREISAYCAAKLAAGFHPKSINNHLAILSKALKMAAEWDLIPSPRPIRQMKVPPARFDFLTFEEADALLAASRDELLRMVCLALRTGLRTGEILALRWVDVEEAGRRIVVRRSAVEGNVGPPKNGRAREIPLTSDALAALQAQRATAKRRELVFPHPGHGGIRMGQDLWTPLQDAATAAGLLPRPSGKEAMGWHTLRHTFASHLVMRGAPLKAVQELMGHASMEMTMRYAHLAPEAKSATVALLESTGHMTATWSVNQRNSVLS